KIFFETLEKIAKEDRSVFLLSCDLGVKFLQNFQNIDPGRFVNMGIAESNMIGVAAGMSMSGKNVYCYSIIPFLIMRTFEQIRIDLCYNYLNVKLLGAGGGLVYGMEGMTHHAVEDIAIMRALPNMTVVAPGDVRESEALAKASVSFPGPLYIRFGRDANPVIHGDDFKFEIGKGIIVNEGENVCLIVTGTMLYTAKIVSDSLRGKGINPTLISMHTIKPIDEQLIRECAKKYDFIFTLEEHSILGGLGGAVAEVLAESKYGGNFKRIGIPDKYSYPDIGGWDYLCKKLGIDSGSITQLILKTVK
ncbi:MAG: transketolase C-terminal domain-containing protein, partial [Patescibacteria group bacterium]